jgi:hypothetical protein
MDVGEELRPVPRLNGAILGVYRPIVKLNARQIVSYVERLGMISDAVFSGAGVPIRSAPQIKAARARRIPGPSVKFHETVLDYGPIVVLIQLLEHHSLLGPLALSRSIARTV